jgi:chromosomal replication initiator protein
MRFIQTPESCSALIALQTVGEGLVSGGASQALNPVYLHGPPGCGKTHLVSLLVEEVTRRSPQLVVTRAQAADLAAVDPPGDEATVLQQASSSDLFIVEDLQHLGGPGAGRGEVVEPFVQVFDDLLAQRRQMVFTANVGPGQLGRFPSRLTSRLGCGLVVGLEGPREESRLALLQEKAQQRQLPLSRDVLAWLAGHLVGGGRQLEGALAQLEALARLHEHPLDVRTVSAYFSDQAEVVRPTVERIAQRVGAYFRVEPKRLQSRCRHQNVLLPRQVGMYLARRLTDLSLGQIGAYFGGRDHSTVLHACRKIKQALTHDAILNGAVRQLASDLA